MFLCSEKVRLLSVLALPYLFFFGLYCEFAGAQALPASPIKAALPQADSFLNADFDGNGLIDASDLIDLLKRDGFSVGFEGYSIRHDLNGDEVVNQLDVVLLMDAWKSQLSPRTPITPEDLRKKIETFNLDPAGPGDRDQNPDSMTCFYDVVTRNGDGSFLEESLPAVVVVGSATEEGGGSTFSYLVGLAGGYGPLVSGVSDTGPISIGRLDLLGEAPINVPTGSLVLPPQNYWLSNPLDLTPSDLVVSGQPTISHTSVEASAIMNLPQSGDLPWISPKGLTLGVSYVFPVTSESRWFDISYDGDWSEIFFEWGLTARVSYNFKGIDEADDFRWTAGIIFRFGEIEFVDSTFANSQVEKRQYRNLDFDEEECYLEESLEPNDTTEEAALIPVAGVVCLNRGTLFHTDEPDFDLEDRFTLMPAFDGTMEVACILNRTELPVATQFTFTEGMTPLEEFLLEAPPEGVRVNIRILNLPVQRNQPISVAAAITGAASEFSNYSLSMRYTDLVEDCSPEVEPNNLLTEAQLLTDHGCVTGSVSTLEDPVDVFQLSTAAPAKTAQILLDYEQKGDPAMSGAAELFPSFGGSMSPRILTGKGQAAFYAPLDPSEPLTFEIRSENGSRVDYSFSYSLTDRPAPEEGACRNEPPDNATQEMALAINPPDCVTGRIDHPDKGESWFSYTPPMDGVFHVIGEVTPEGGAFDGALEIRSATPLSPSLAAASLLSPTEFFPLSTRLKGGEPTLVRWTNDGMVSQDGSGETKTLFRFAPDDCRVEEEAAGLTSNDLLEDAEDIASASCVSGSIDGAGDLSDSYYYKEEQGGQFWFLIPARSATSSEEIFALLFDENGFNGLTEPISPDYDTILTVPNSPAGSEWYLSIASASDAFDYTVRILRPTACLLEVEGNNSPATATLIDATACIQAAIGVEVGDQKDYFRVKVAETGPLRVALLGGHFGDPGVAHIRFLDSSLRPIQQSILYDTGAASFQYGAIAGEEILIEVEQDFGPLYYELRVEQP